MTILQIDTDDRNKIDEFITLALKKFNFKIKIKDEVKTRKRPISSYLDTKIKNAESINTKKAEEIKEALNGLNTLVDSKNLNLSVSQAREQYFINKAN